MLIPLGSYYFKSTAEKSLENAHTKGFETYEKRKRRELYERTDSLIQGIFDECFIKLKIEHVPGNQYYFEHKFDTRYSYSCILKKDGVEVKSSSENDENADFNIVATVDAYFPEEFPFVKSFRALWNGEGFHDYYFTMIKRIEPIFSKQISQEEKKLITNMCKLANKHYELIQIRQDRSYRELKRLV